MRLSKQLRFGQNCSGDLGVRLLATAFSRILRMKTIDVAFYREGNQWVAQAMDVEVSTFADTLEEARAAMQEALELYFDGN